MTDVAALSPGRVMSAAKRKNGTGTLSRATCTSISDAVPYSGPELSQQFEQRVPGAHLAQGPACSPKLAPVADEALTIEFQDLLSCHSSTVGRRGSHDFTSVRHRPEVYQERNQDQKEPREDEMLAGLQAIPDAAIGPRQPRIRPAEQNRLHS